LDTSTEQKAENLDEKEIKRAGSEENKEIGLKIDKEEICRNDEIKQQPLPPPPQRAYSFNCGSSQEQKKVFLTILDTNSPNFSKLIFKKFIGPTTKNFINKDT
jgi:hypothetical protein